MSTGFLHTNQIVGTALAMSEAVYKADPVRHLNLDTDAHGIVAARVLACLPLTEGHRFLVGEAEDAVYIAFKGTSMKNTSDLLTDINVSGTTHTAGLIHSGFLSRREVVPVDDLLKTALAMHPPRKVVFCGHSLGGAVAHLCALHAISVQEEAAREGRILSVAFGSPFVGDAKVNEYVENHGLTHMFLTVVNHMDPVPSMLNPNKSSGMISVTAAPAAPPRGDDGLFSVLRNVGQKIGGYSVSAMTKMLMHKMPAYVPLGHYYLLRPDGNQWVCWHFNDAALVSGELTSVEENGLTFEAHQIVSYKASINQTPIRVPRSAEPMARTVELTKLFEVVIAGVCVRYGDNWMRIEIEGEHLEFVLPAFPFRAGGSMIRDYDRTHLPLILGNFPMLNGRLVEMFRGSERLEYLLTHPVQPLAGALGNSSIVIPAGPKMLRLNTIMGETDPWMLQADDLLHVEPDEVASAEVAREAALTRAPLYHVNMGMGPARPVGDGWSVEASGFVHPPMQRGAAAVAIGMGEGNLADIPGNVPDAPVPVVEPSAIDSSMGVTGEARVTDFGVPATNPLVGSTPVPIAVAAVQTQPQPQPPVPPGVALSTSPGFAPPSSGFGAPAANPFGGPPAAAYAPAYGFAPAPTAPPSGLRPSTAPARTVPQPAVAPGRAMPAQYVAPFAGRSTVPAVAPPTYAVATTYPLQPGEPIAQPAVYGAPRSNPPPYTPPQ